MESVWRRKGQELDYVRKLKLIHGCRAHKSSFITLNKETAALGEIKKREVSGVRQAQCFLLRIYFNPQAGLECFPACTWWRADKDERVLI